MSYRATLFFLLAALVAALPGKGNIALERFYGRGCGCCGSHRLILPLRHSMVMLLTSSRLVSPFLTFSSPARLRSQTPSLAA